MTTALNLAVETNILIVDDNPDNLRLLTKILDSHGYIVRKSLNGKMAIQGIHRAPPDLIILDINMPNMNGYEVCQQLKANELTAGIPIIFISAFDQLVEKFRSFELGGVDYITKPFHEQEVLLRVKNQLIIQQQGQQLQKQHQLLEQEIQQRIWFETQIKQLCLIDGLTQLYNQKGFFLLVEQQLKIARRMSIPYCILYAYLDGLKPINDPGGQKMRDQMIVDAAQILKQTFRDADIVARIGEDRFALFLPFCSDKTDDFYERLQGNMARFNQQHDRALISINLTVQTADFINNISLEQLVAQMDKYKEYHQNTKTYLKR